jgi:hypothetical protein
VHLLHDFLVGERNLDAMPVSEALVADYRATGGRSRLRFERGDSARMPPRVRQDTATPARQTRHLQS